MHKTYPYLQDSFIYQTDIEREKRNILNEIDSFVNQRQYVKITLLNWDEEPIKAIEGEISSGSISKVGDSPIRRTAQLTCAVDARSYSVDDGKADFAINKKVFIEIGVKNETPHYPEFPIFWFPEGVFFIGSFSINSGSNSSTNITLSLKDKMAMLNGDVGGTLPSTVIFDTMDTQLPNGEYIEKKVLIYNIIQELVNHYGGEDLSRIVIEGVPLRIRRIMQWNGDKPIYQIYTGENFDIVDNNSGLEIYEFTTNQDDVRIAQNNILPFYKGEDIGYIMDDFVIIDELTGAPGETVTAILDKIKNILGNYEYYYDVFGTFHFREIKNYYVTTQARTLLDEMSENDYLVETNNSRSIYTFDDKKLLTSINVTPQYENIKNDYIVEGQTNIADSDITVPIRYHLAIDKKPPILGKDNRENIRQKIDNSDLIQQKEEELKKWLTSKNNSKTLLEELLYNIRNAKTYIADKEAQIDIKDKELLKQLQDIFHTSYTHLELMENKEADTLLSEQWLKLTYGEMIKDSETVSVETLLERGYHISLNVSNNKLYLDDINLNTATIKNITVKLNNNIDIISLLDNNNIEVTIDYDNLAIFIQTVIFPDTGIYQNKVDQYWNEQQALLADKQEFEDFLESINNITVEDIDNPNIIQKINAYSNGTNFAEDDQLYRTTKEALAAVELELKQVTAQYEYYNTLNNQQQTQINHIRTNLLNVLAIIRQLQQQRQNKIEFLDGTPDHKFVGIENNHENLIKYNDDAINWFSYNTEKIMDTDCTSIQNDEYSFISNNILLTITLSKDKEYNFYENSLFNKFYVAFNKYYATDTTDVNNINNNIQELENLIATLTDSQGNFDNISNINQGKPYYEIYPTEEEEMILYQHPRNNLVCAAYVEKVDELLDVGNFNLIYKNNNTYYYWDGKTYQELEPLEVYDNTDADGQNLYYAYDWRTKLYLDGLKSVINGTDKGYYYAELSAFWPQVYNLRTQKFFKEEKDSSRYQQELAVAGTYYLDFLDETETSFGEWSVNNIGRRSDIIVKEEINCLFQPEIPNVILLPSNAIDLSSIGKNPIDKIYRYGNSLEGEWTLEQLKTEAINNFYPYTQVSSEIYNNLLTGGYKNGAFDQIKYELYLHTRYQKSISLTSIPVFYLEPNNRISINDTTTNTYGDFVIQSINLTLGPGANMSITCNETAERF